MRVVASAPFHPPDEDGMLRWSMLLECGHSAEVVKKKGTGYPRTAVCPKCGDDPPIPEPEPIPEPAFVEPAVESEEPPDPEEPLEPEEPPPDPPPDPPKIGKEKAKKRFLL